MGLGLGSNLTKGGLTTPGIITDNLVLKHNYAANGNIPVSDGAAYFDGSDSGTNYIGVSDSSDFNHVADGVSKFSTCCWFRNTAGNPDSNDTLISKYDTGANKREWRLSTNANDKISIWVSANGTATISSISDYVLNDTLWHHVALVYDGSESTALDRAKFYIDGVKYGSTASGGDLPAAIYENDIDLTISGFTTSGTGGFSSWLGYICNVGYWSRVLTQSEIKSIMWKNYANLTGDSTSGEKQSLVSWWNLDSTMSSNGGTSNVFDNHYGGGDQLGSELWDGTDSYWTGYGDNTVVSEDGAVKITGSGSGASHASGAYVYLSSSGPTSGTDANDTSKSVLSTDLTIGGTYRLRCDVKVDPGDEVSLRVNKDGSSELSAVVDQTNTDFETIDIYFTADHARNAYFYAPGCNPGDIIYIKNFSFKKVNGNPGELL